MNWDREVSGPRHEGPPPAPRDLRCIRGHKLGELFEALLLKIRCRRCKRDMNFSLTDDCGTDIDS